MSKPLNRLCTPHRLNIWKSDLFLFFSLDLVFWCMGSCAKFIAVNKGFPKRRKGMAAAITTSRVFYTVPYFKMPLYIHPQPPPLLQPSYSLLTATYLNLQFISFVDFFL